MSTLIWESCHDHHVHACHPESCVLLCCTAPQFTLAAVWAVEQSAGFVRLYIL